MKLRAIGLFLACAFLGTSALADGIRPVTVRVKEQEAGKFLVQWRVPTQLPTKAIPSPLLPDSCHATGDRAVVERPGAWFLRQIWVCPDGLNGNVLGIEYPFMNAVVGTLLRVELLSGERYAHMLAPGETSWPVPESATGGAPAWMREARDGVLAGAAHFAGNGIHLAFLLALLLLGGGFSTTVRLATTFTAGQGVAVVLGSLSGVTLGAPFAEVGVAVAAALLAREALRPVGERRQLFALAGCAGLAHGLGIAGIGAPGAVDGAASVLGRLAIVLGMDAALLLAAAVVTGLTSLLPQRVSHGALRTVSIYVIAGLALGLAFASPLIDAGTRAADKPKGLQLPDLPIPDGSSGTPGSRRVAAQFPDAALQSFVAIDAFEVRHEVLVRLQHMADRLDLAAVEDLPIERQAAIKQSIRDMVLSRTRLAIDGTTVQPVDVRVDFLGLDSTGARPRLAPIVEPLAEAWVGVTPVYLTDATPREVEVAWERFDLADTIPATVTDPETSRSVSLSASRPALRWANELFEDPAPVVTALAVEPVTVWLPLLSLTAFGAAVVFGWAAVRGRRRETSIALVRVLLAVALLLGPVGGVAVAVPRSAGSTPDAMRAARVLGGVLPNVYRAFQFPTETAVYDHLALSVTGDTLTEIYLEHRHAVRMEERGGAKARVEAVEVIDVTAVEPGDGGAFLADAVWTVGGTVTHFGHRHFRQNRYDARVTVLPVDGYWKIQSVEVHDVKRVK